ncbi:DHH family phosphoesterase [Roseomonas haemaphysalidis]|uniref:DHH family phosphoesterase n=1 Tax=Roseomonas haemaphysalidis TaxID=2768162 RepID=A0ABS3KMI4_9PROT|nr:DHH family phosphoesterase [Roseomonas haemaphysalidis]MBO1077793.1 DHH family phosphoesterase [Roseomonas haemaphysalidis]
MTAPADARAATASRFADAIRAFDRTRPVWVLGHNDADGLSATALFARGFRAAGWEVRTRIVGRGESPWSDSMRSELAAEPMGGLVITDLGVQDALPRPGVPTVVVDHHVPGAPPEGATVITGFGQDPIPTASLLAFWCAGALADAEPWLWLAAVGLIGDMADKAGFPEMEAARRFGVTALRDTAALVNAPRRSASGDAGPALALLLAADGPKDLLATDRPEAAALLAARAEVKAALDAARRVAPVVRGDVALIRFSSPTQIHPLIAQQWRGRLKDNVVMAANTGYRPGWVHFAIRSARDRDLIAFLAEHRPPGADEMYGSGHRQATGGALRPESWNSFVQGLGFGPEFSVPEQAA